jgi:gamma-tubulin complex component 3
MIPYQKNRYIRDLVGRTLDAVNRPITTMLHRWIYEGELDDPNGEFLVSEDPTIPVADLWASKYAIRESMLPAFMSSELCGKILLIGKSINFIRKVLNDSEPVFRSTPEFHTISGFALHNTRVLGPIVEEVCKIVSKRLLEIFFQRYKFVEHLNAIKRYLLLGQGDFILHLMDVLHEDLARPAGSLYLHNLTSILETAVRATNAQYDSPEILGRLDVQMFDVSPGDVGWDVFTLIYRNEGPIGAVLTEDAVRTYLQIFNFLWRAKRMEFVLSQVWSKQMAFSRSLSQVKEMAGALKLSEVMHAAMQHFINQIQYYFVYVFCACCWRGFCEGIRWRREECGMETLPHLFGFRMCSRSTRRLYTIHLRRTSSCVSDSC